MSKSAMQQSPRMSLCPQCHAVYLLGLDPADVDTVCGNCDYVNAKATIASLSAQLSEIRELATRPYTAAYDVIADLRTVLAKATMRSLSDDISDKTSMTKGGQE